MILVALLAIQQQLSLCLELTGLMSETHLDEAGFLRSKDTAGIVSSEQAFASTDLGDADQPPEGAVGGQKLGREASFQASRR